MKLYDSFSGEKQEFTPYKKEVGMYVCGPNLYGPCHVGHALSFIIFDVLRRYLEYQGYKVKHVQNFTDIEDRIIEVALQEGRTIGDLSEQYIERFLNEMDQLGVQRAHYYPRATAYIPKMVDIIQGLIKKGYAYVAGDDVYYRVRNFINYGHLSRRSLDEMQAGVRIEVNPSKEDPMDFILWKAAKDNEPAWESPWGQGRPGWHIECSAMSLNLLGDQVDIHGGGQDVVFPHHENEIAQSESYTGITPFVQYWVHNGLLRLTESDDEKMTRHSGNFVSCRDALARYHTDAIRLFLLSSHYRGPRTYSESELDGQERAAGRMRTALNAGFGSGVEHVDIIRFRERFEKAMDDDLNTPQALATLFDLTREVNRRKEQGESVVQAQALLRELGGVLGLSFDRPQSDGNVSASPYIDLLIQVRAELREAKQYAFADSLRERLVHLRVTLEDSPEGTTWRFSESE